MFKIAAQKSKMAAKINIKKKSENCVLASEKNLIMLKMTFLDYLQVNNYLSESKIAFVGF